MIVSYLQLNVWVRSFSLLHLFTFYFNPLDPFGHFKYSATHNCTIIIILQGRSIKLNGPSFSIANLTNCLLSGEYPANQQDEGVMETKEQIWIQRVFSKIQCQSKIWRANG